MTRSIRAMWRSRSLMRLLDQSAPGALPRIALEVGIAWCSFSSCESPPRQSRIPCGSDGFVALAIDAVELDGFA